MRHKECLAEEFYVFTVAVRPDLQSHGLGKNLLAMAQRKAIEAQLPKIALGVTLDNHRAVRFYSRMGFEIVQTVRTPGLRKTTVPKRNTFATSPCRSITPRDSAE